MKIRIEPKVSAKVGTCDRHSVYVAGCEGCKERSRIKRRTAYREKAYGRWQPSRCDATPAREYITKLVAEHNMTLRQIAAAAGTCHSNVAAIAAGTQTGALRRTIEAICAIQPGTLRRPTVPAHGAARRLQALAAIGYSGVDLAPMLRTDVQWVRRWRRQYRPTISVRRHGDIADLYRSLLDKPGPSDRARQDAARNGWVSPVAWRDIDDLGERPELGGGELPADDVLDVVAVSRVLHGHAPIGSLRTQADLSALWRAWLHYRAEYGLDGPGITEFAMRHGITKAEATRIRDASVGRPTQKHNPTTAASECRANESEAA